jgi:hypothetical protein
MVAVSGCSQSPPPIVMGPAYAPPGSFGVVPQETSADGRPVIYDETVPWCYRDAWNLQGGRCFDAKWGCDAYLKDLWMHEVFTTAAELENKGVGDEKTRLEAAGRHVAKRWPPCSETDAVACFRIRGVLDNVELRLCTVTVESCERDLREQRRNPDYIVRDPRCFVRRVSRSKVGVSD